MRAIIFDFDGTLGDSFKVTLEVGHQLTHHDLLINPREVERLRGMRLMDVAHELGIKTYQWPFLLYRGRRLMRQHLSEIEPFSGTEEVLKTLKNNGYKLFIMSSNSKQNIDSFLAEHNLVSYFEKIYGGVGLLSKARSLRKILKQNHLTSDQAVYVGDEPRDIQAATQEKMTCVAVGWGFNTHEMLAQHSPMIVVDSRPELIAVLKQWGAS